jgi:uncharacterized repeat protein (TIGR02543 family)
MKLKLLYITLVLFALCGSGYGQVSYLGLDGGLEGSATINNTAQTAAAAGEWRKNNATQTIANETTTVRSGANSLSVNNSSTTGRRVWSPNFTVSSTTSALTIQYYRYVANTTNTQQNQEGINRPPAAEALQGTYDVPVSAGTWEKQTYSPTSGTFTDIAGIIMHRQTGTGGSMFIDDMAVYTGGVDTTAPNVATAASAGSPTTSSLTVGWTAASGGIDGGGYLVVRGTSDPSTAPNINGIYAVGNTIAAGMTVVYRGTGTSFIDTGAAGTQYFYRVYTYDKAYNYAAAATCNGTTTSSGFTVTFNGNGNTGGTMAAQTASSATALTTNTFTRTGYTFAGWNTINVGGGTAYADGASYPFTANTTLYAQWTPNNNTITFDKNAVDATGTTANQTVATDAIATLTSNGYSRTGYTFSGWNTAANGSGTSYADGASYTMGTANVTLYAVWTVTGSFTVTFNANGGTGSMANQIANTATALTTNTFTRAGFIFSGWNTLVGGGGTTYTDGASYPFTADTTLYAQWTAIYTFTYNGNSNTGGTAPTDASSPYVAGATVTVKANTGTLVRTGYTFAGWNTASNGSGTDYAATGSATLTMPAANTILYAKWTPITITATPTSLTLFTYAVGSGPSAEQSFTVSGSNLTANLVVTPSTNYEISSTSGSGFGSSVTLTPTTGTVSNTTIYVRLKAGLATGNYNTETIACSSTGATTVNVTCSGAVTQATLTVSITTLSGFTYEAGSGPSTEQSFTVSGSNLTANLVVTPSTNYEISSTSGSGFGSSVTLTPTTGTVANTTIYIRLKAGLAVANYNLENIAATSSGATTQNVSCSGSVTVVVPVLLKWNTFGNAGTETTEPSTFNDANIAAANLTQGSITAAANTNRFGGSGWFDTGNTTGGNTLAEAVAGNDYIQFIVTPNSGSSFTPTSFVFGWERSNTGPSNVALRSSVDGFVSDLGSVTGLTTSVTSGNTITISGLTNITTATTFRLYGYGATATGGTGGLDQAASPGAVNVRLNGTTATSCTNPSLAFATASYPKNIGDANFTQTATTTSAGTITYASDNTAAATVNATTGEVTIGATAGTATITASQVADGIYCAATATYTVVVTSTAPSITASGTLSALSTTLGTASSNTSFTVSAANLTNNLIITPPSGFEVSLSSGTGFTTSLDLGTSNRTNTTIYVRLAATTAIGTYSGDISLASTGLTTVNVATATSTVTSVPSCSPPIWEENFNYGSCDNANLPNLTSNWTTFSGSSSNAQYKSSSLTYGTYPSSGIGGSFSFETGGSDDIQRTITTTATTSGSVYASFLVNFNSNTTTDDYFAGFRTSSGALGARVFVQKSGTQLKLGISKNQTTSDATTGLLNFDTTYLVVVKYSIVGGGVNDTFQLWVFNSETPLTEALATTIYTPLSATASNTDAVDISTFYLRQTNKAKGFVDGIRVATSWENLFCGTAPIATTYTWTGTSSASWANSGNWSPSGIPSSSDNIIINSGGTNTLNITDCRTVKDFTLNGTGAFAMSATGVFTINGDVTYGGTPTATLDCASHISIKSATSQPVPPLTYGNLDILGGPRVFPTTGIIKICSAFDVDQTLYSYTVTNSTVEYISSSSWIMTPFTYNNLTFSGSGTFSFGSSTPAADKIINVLGDFVQSNGSVFLGDTASKTATLNIDGNMTISGGNFDHNNTSGGTGILNLKGDLSVSATAQLTASNVGGKLNFVGTGDGTTEALTQSIDIKNTNSVYNTALSVNSGFAKLANQDLYLGTNSSFEVKSGALFNFAFAADNATALNIVRVSTRTGQTFSAKSGSTLKLTSPLGITAAGTYTGNVQIGAAAADRTFDVGTTYHYIGKANQVAGLGLPTGLTAKVIVELDTDALTFNASGNKAFTTTGTLEIRKGIVVDDSTNSFGEVALNTANLTMSGGRYRITKTGTQPNFTGTYSLSAGTVEYANSQITAETIRNKSYQNIEVTGNNVGNSNGNITLNGNGTFTVKTGGIFTINDNAIVGPTGTQTVTVENGATFKTGDPDGFNGGTGTTATSVRSDIENINLITGSTVEYSRNGDQIITLAGYSNLTVSGTSGTKTLASTSATKVGNDLSVNASTLKIESGKALTVTNKVYVNPAATMTCETSDLSESGSLIQINETDTNDGNITYNRRVPVIRSTDYTYWSSPVSGQDLYNFSANTPTDMFYAFDSSILPEDWSLITTSSAMVRGIGYCIYGEQISGTPPGFFNAVFVGKPHNGTFTVPITYNGAPDGTSNLIGNPYPSAIDAYNFLSTNSGVIEGTIYFWTHNTAIQLASNIPAGNAGSGTYAYTKEDYASFNLLGGVGTSRAPSGNTGGFNTNIPNGKIAAGQAFFATSLLANGTVTFKNSMRLSSDAVPAVLTNSQFFKTKNPATKTATIERHRIWLDLTNTQGLFKQTLIGYITDATNQYDTRFDGISYDGNEFADFYSISQDKNLVIQGRALPFDENDQVPLGFRTTIEGAFAINIDQADGLLTDQPVYIEDKLTNTTFDLRTGAYNFTSKSGTFNDRFVLRYTDKTLGTTDFDSIEKQVLVSYKNKQLKINSKVETIDKVVVFDLLGRQLFKKDKVNGNELTITNLVSSQQTLLVKVVLQNGQTVTKKVLF